MSTLMPNQAVHLKYGDWNGDVDACSVAGAALEYRKINGIKPSGSDSKKVTLLLIDTQRDFCCPEGSLFVKGAPEGNKKITEFILTNLDRITQIWNTMDTHWAYSIFFDAMWVDDNGDHPPIMSTIEADDVPGKWKPNPRIASWMCKGNYDFLVQQFKHYVSELQKGGKYSLTIWPPHCLLGTIGHALTPAIMWAKLFHSYVRGMQDWCEVKGVNPWTENYSVLAPEVTTFVDGRPLDQKNMNFLKTLLDSDAVLIGGYASSHCFAWTIDDLLQEIKRQDPSLVKKVFIMKEMTAPVVVPGVVDYTNAAEEAIKRFGDEGMNVIEDCRDLDSWLKL